MFFDVFKSLLFDHAPPKHKRDVPFPLLGQYRDDFKYSTPSTCTSGDLWNRSRAPKTQRNAIRPHKIYKYLHPHAQSAPRIAPMVIKLQAWYDRWMRNSANGRSSKNECEQLSPVSNKPNDAPHNIPSSHDRQPATLRKKQKNGIANAVPSALAIIPFWLSGCGFPLCASRVNEGRNTSGEYHSCARRALKRHDG